MKIMKIKHSDIAIIEVLHDLLLEDHSLNFHPLKNARDLTKRMYEAKEIEGVENNPQKTTILRGPKVFWDDLEVKKIIDGRKYIEINMLLFISSLNSIEYSLHTLQRANFNWEVILFESVSEKELKKILKLKLPFDEIIISMESTQ